jgi:hypothetical protein
MKECSILQILVSKVNEDDDELSRNLLACNQRGGEFLNAYCATLLDNPFLALSMWQNKRVR